MGVGRKKRIYLAGPISKGDMLHNIGQADDAMFALMKAGFAPLNPMLSVFAGGAIRNAASDEDQFVYSIAKILPKGTTHAEWLGIDLPWVEVADAVLRLPGESKGAAAEVAKAKEHGIPVFNSIDDVIAWGQSYEDPKPGVEPAEAGHPEYLRILDEMRELHIKKAGDYGRGSDPFANVRASADFGIPAWVGTMVRAMDKVHRIKSYVLNGSLKNESLEDSLKDLAAYSLIALVLFREEQQKAA